MKSSKLPSKIYALSLQIAIVAVFIFSGRGVSADDQQLQEQSVRCENVFDSKEETSNPFLHSILNKNVQIQINSSLSKLPERIKDIRAKDVGIWLLKLTKSNANTFLNPMPNLRLFNETSKTQNSSDRFILKMRQALALAMSLNLAVAVEQAVEMEHNTTTVEQFISEPSYQNNLPKVEIFVESTPAPHMAIRIGPKVYSYGTSHMTVKSVSQYLMAQKIEAALKKDNLSIFQKLMQTDPLIRSVRTVEIKMNEKEIRNLENSLIENTGKRYQNITFINDCSTMIARHLHKNSKIDIPWIVDAFPTSFASYLSIQKFFGNKDIGATKLIIFENSHSNLHVIRNTLIGAVEGKLFLSMFFMNTTSRLMFDVKFDEKDLTIFDQATKDKLAQIQRETQLQYQEYLEGFGFRKEIEALQKVASTSSQEKSELVVKIDALFEIEENNLEETLQRHSLTYTEVQSANQKRAILKNFKMDLLNLINHKGN